ncbi:hypothetical protein K3495_g4503 [Podosphaera aphanis]|nr:hypothetical protein K3495_g4503 [Podosphaera aphanis]
MEAEIMASSDRAKELTWMEEVSSDLDVTVKIPPTLWTDNLAATELTNTTKIHNKANNIEVRYFFIRDDMVQRDRLKVMHTSGTEQIADILTKPLPKEKFRK